MAKRQYLSIAQKRAIVAEKQQNKISMKQLAEKHHVSDSMIYSWQKQFREEQARIIPNGADVPDIKTLVDNVKHHHKKSLPVLKRSLAQVGGISEREQLMAEQLEAAMDENEVLKRIIMTLGRAL